jgi:hypothetical protein
MATLQTRIYLHVVREYTGRFPTMSVLQMHILEEALLSLKCANKVRNVSDQGI